MLRFRSRHAVVPSPRTEEDAIRAAAVSNRGKAPPAADRREAIVRAQFDDPDKAAAYATHHLSDGPSKRFYTARIRLVGLLLGLVPAGVLLDVGCGPGMFLRFLEDSRPGVFRLAGVDQSSAMIAGATERLADVPSSTMLVGKAESLPFASSSFDVVVATGVLEYSDVGASLDEFFRVLRPDGIALISMLNPLSPYRLVEWFLLWPFIRMLGRFEGLLGRPASRRHGRDLTGIKALPPRRLRQSLRRAGLTPERLEYFDATWTLPPFDRLLPSGGERLSRRAPSRFGTGYLVVARRAP